MSAIPLTSTALTTPHLCLYTAPELEGTMTRESSSTPKHPCMWKVKVKEKTKGKNYFKISHILALHT